MTILSCFIFSTHLPNIIELNHFSAFADKIDIIGCNITFHGNIDINLLNTLAINIDIT